MLREWGVAAVVDAVEVVVATEKGSHPAAAPVHLPRCGVQRRGWQAKLVEFGSGSASGLVPRTSWTGSRGFQRSH